MCRKSETRLQILYENIKNLSMHAGRLSLKSERKKSLLPPEYGSEFWATLWPVNLNMTVTGFPEMSELSSAWRFSQVILPDLGNFLYLLRLCCDHDSDILQWKMSRRTYTETLNHTVDFNGFLCCYYDRCVLDDIMQIVWTLDTCTILEILAYAWLPTQC